MTPRTIRAARPLFALALVAIALAGCAKHETPGDGAETPALLADTDVARAVRTDLAAGLPVSGTLTPAIDVRISAPLGEIVESVAVREGQAVRQGQELARFRATSLAPAAAGAAAELKAAQAEYDRAQNLFKAGAMSRRDVESAEARWKSAEANAAQATKTYGDAVVRAPVAGVIAEKVIEAGDRPGVGDPMFRLVNTSGLEFEATVPSEYVTRVRVGAPVALTLSGFGPGAITGTVARVNATADPATRQVKVYVRVPNPRGTLVGGLYAQGVIVTGAAHDALAVPDAAVRAQGDSAFVWTIETGRLTRHAVRAGLRDADRGLTEIVSGLDEGATVVTGAVAGLAPGQRVSVGADSAATGAKGR